MTRPSTSSSLHAKSWMPGTSPGMTSWKSLPDEAGQVVLVMRQGLGRSVWPGAGAADLSRTFAIAPIVWGPKWGARQHTDGTPGKIVLSTVDGQKLTKTIALGPE